MAEGLARFQESVCAQMGEPWPERRDRVEVYLRAGAVERFAVLGPDALNPELLTRLRDTYERVRFVALGEHGVVAQLALAVDGTVIDPPLPPGEEDAARVAVISIHEVLGPTR